MNLKAAIIGNILFPIGDFVTRSEVSRQLKLHRSYSKLGSDELHEIQKAKLSRLLNHATSTCDFYYKCHRFVNTDFPYESIQKFPVISKQIVSSNQEKFLSKLYQKKHLIKYETSGSSGIRSEVFFDKKEQSVCRAILINWWEWGGFFLGKPLLQTGMTPTRGFIKRIKDIVLSTHYIDAFKLKEEELLNHLRRVEGKQGYMLAGYASSLFVLAQVAEEHALNVSFDSAISFGDKLFSHYKEKIESVFRCSLYENYGLNEGFMIGQKKDLPYYYIYTPSVYLEILDENNNPVPDGSIGRIIATKLDGYAMPLIRYDTGDLGIMLPLSEYPRVRDMAFPLLKMVVGRNTDIVRTSDGNNLIVHTFTGIFEFFPEIQQFQIVQDRLDSVTIRIVISPRFKDDILQQIERMIKNKTNSSIEISWEYVSGIPASKSGKPQIIVNNLVNQSLADIID